MKIQISKGYSHWRCSGSISKSTCILPLNAYHVIIQGFVPNLFSSLTINYASSVFHFRLLNLSHNLSSFITFLLSPTVRPIGQSLISINCTLAVPH